MDGQGSRCPGGSCVGGLARARLAGPPLAGESNTVSQLTCGNVPSRRRNNPPYWHAFNIPPVRKASAQGDWRISKGLSCGTDRGSWKSSLEPCRGFFSVMAGGIPSQFRDVEVFPSRFEGFTGCCLHCRKQPVEVLIPPAAVGENGTTRAKAEPIFRERLGMRISGRWLLVEPKPAW